MTGPKGPPAKYRLPRDVLDAEINRILAMGVTLELNAAVTDLLAELTQAADGLTEPFALTT